MKLHLLDRSNLTNSSFTTKINEYPYFLKIWHYHPELELVAVLRNEGTCFIGDSVEKFSIGDVVLIGKNLPHMWLNDEGYFKQTTEETAKAIAIHFKEDYLGPQFFKTPEMVHILELFKRSRYGLKFLNVNKKLIDDMLHMLELKGFEKTMAFLNILHTLARHTAIKKLSSQGFINSFNASKSNTQDNVQAYIFKNFNLNITLNKAAEVAHMNPSAFSRYFKRVNKKTFSKYVTEIRIGYACKLLLENKFNISKICYESGFNNISNFNRQFKLVMNYTPSEYLEKHKTKHD